MEQGLPISTVDANKDHIAYQWEQVSGTPRLSRVTYESKDGVTELQRTAAGWTATRDDARLIPAQAKITDVGVEGQGAELTVSVDRAPADGGPRNLSFRSDGARSSSIPNTSDAISNLLKTGTVIPDQADVNEEGLLEIIRYGTVSDGEGNRPEFCSERSMTPGIRARWTEYAKPKLLVICPRSTKATDLHRMW